MPFNKCMKSCDFFSRPIVHKTDTCHRGRKTPTYFTRNSPMTCRGRIRMYACMYGFIYFLVA